MNLMGKIFTLLIFFLSVSFLVLSVMVGATHRNWKEIASKNEQDAQIAASRLSEFKQDRTELDAKLRAEQIARQLQLSQLFTQATRDAALRDNLSKANSELGKELTRIQSQFAIVNQRVIDQDGRIGVLQTDNNTLIDNIADQRKKVVNLTNEIYRLRGELDLLTKSSAALAAQNAKQQRVLAANGLNENSLTEQVAKKLEGVVVQTKDDLIAVSLGTDDGLKVGHYVEIYRDTKFIGKAEVTVSDHNTAAARLIPQYTNITIREGDYVTTKL